MHTLQYISLFFGAHINYFATLHGATDIEIKLFEYSKNKPLDTKIGN